MKKQIVLNIPQNWGEVSLGNYQNYVNSSGSNVPNEIIYNTISAFCDVDIEDVKRFKLEDLKKVHNSLNALVTKELNHL